MSNDMQGLVETAYADLYRFAYRMLGGESLAADIVQESFLRFAQQGPGPGNREVARRWLFVVARNLCISHLRKAVRASSEAPEPPESADPSRIGQSIERQQWVAQAVSALPPAMREAVILREYEGLTYAEIATLAGCSEGTVKSRLARARELLRKRLTPLWEAYR